MNWLARTVYFESQEGVTVAEAEFKKKNINIYICIYNIFSFIYIYIYIYTQLLMHNINTSLFVNDFCNLAYFV